MDKLVPRSIQTSDQQVRLKRIEDSAPAEKEVGREVLAKRKDDSTFPAEISMGPALFEGEQMIIAAIRDITERKRIETIVRQSEERFSALIESSNDAVLTTTSRGSIITWNKGAERIFGWQSDEVIGQSIQVIMPNEMKPLHQAGMDRYVKTGEAKIIGKPVELIAVRKDGSKVPVELSLGTWSDDSERYFSGILRDITYRKHAQEELHRTKAQFQGAFEYSAIGMALVSLQGKWMKVNHRLSSLLGYTESEFLQTTFQDITHPEDLDKDLENVQRMLRKELDTYQMEKRYIHKEGHLVWALLNVSLVTDSGGDPLYFVSQIENITERKNAEQERENLVSQLSNRNKQLREFSQIVSHNMRSPISNLGILMDFLEAAKTEEDREVVMEKLRHVTESMNVLMEDLVETVKVLNNAELKPELLSIQEIVKKVRTFLSLDIVATNAQIELDTSAWDKITYPRMYMESTLLNLLNNAIKYRDPQRTPQISVCTAVEKGVKKLIVSDNGSGIDMKRNGNRVFGLHNRFHKNTQGKGLGLFMTKTQVESQGGSIDLDSTLGEGCTFTINFNPYNIHE